MSRAASPGLVVVGASAGGVHALLKMLTPLPREFRIPIAVVLHLPPRGENRLLELLSQRLALRVCEPRDKELACAGTVYLAPADYHLLVERDGRFSFSNDEPESFARPSIDALMTSAAHAFGERLVSVLLTGANHDGAAGMEEVQRRGGCTVVQSPEEAEVPTMPESALAKIRPDHVLRLEAIAARLMELGELG